MMVSEDFAWDAFMRRDRRYDGQFIGAVKTTGIYCKPSCAARHPLRENGESSGLSFVHALQTGRSWPRP
jgi:methylphosphotriester-DNA--protein-cysteine methyltransferase